MNAYAAKAQLSNWVSDSQKHKTKLFLFLLLLPTNLYVAKFSDAIFIISNLFFTYNLFRVNAHYRSMKARDALEHAFAAKFGNSIKWTESKELSNDIKEISNKVSDSLLKDGINWKFTDFNSDLHDDVILKLEERLKLPEIPRTYRRARLEAFIHNQPK